MQAAGAIADVYGTGQQIKVGRAAAELEQAQFNTRLEEERLQSAMASLDAMKALRAILATQRTIAAARGTDSGQGTGFLIGNTSVGNFNSDERIRRMNLLSREAQLRAGGALTGLHQAASETQLGQSLSSRLFQQIPFSELGKEFERVKKTEAGKTSGSIGSINKGTA